MFNHQVFNPILKTDFIGHNVQYFETLDSTNKKAWELIDTDIKNGTIVITNNQINGQGRRGTQWFSSKQKSLTFSIILNNDYIKNYQSFLSLLSGVSCVKAIEKIYGMPCGLKWPNDIMLNNKKIGGILIEARQKYLVLGIGLNVNENNHDINSQIKKRSTSLKLYYKKNIEIELLLATILNEIECHLKANTKDIIKWWTNYCIHMNKEINFHNNKIIIKGNFKGINQNGEGIISVMGERKKIITGAVNI